MRGLALKVFKKGLQEIGKAAGIDRDECRSDGLPEDGHDPPGFGDDLGL